jgi:leader peptidase (prepilin peptidase)/N-methyltransferase
VVAVSLKKKTGLVFTAIAYRFGIAWQTPLWMVFSAGLIVAAAVDIDHQIIPDEISLGGMVVGLVAVPLVLLQTGQDWSAIAYHCGLGAGLGGGLLWIVGFSHARVSVAMGRHFEHWPGEGESLPAPNSLDYWTWFPGLGFGDVKLLAMIGVFLGPVGVMATIVIAAVAGLALGIGWGLATRSFNSPFGFAPAIAAGALVALLVPIRFF